jgi:CheY-like chemotaxis protein
MIVEDDVNNAMVFTTLAERLGNHETEITEDVDQIFKRCRSGSINLVIMDVSLTNSTYDGRKVNGLEITRLLKEDEACRDIPVIIATAHAMQGDKKNFLRESGADGYIEKPIMDPNVFIRTIAELLEKQAEKSRNLETETT